MKRSSMHTITYTFTREEVLKALAKSADLIVPDDENRLDVYGVESVVSVVCKYRADVSESMPKLADHVVVEPGNEWCTLGHHHTKTVCLFRDPGDCEVYGCRECLLRAVDLFSRDCEQVIKEGDTK